MTHYNRIPIQCHTNQISNTVSYGRIFNIGNVEKIKPIKQIHTHFVLSKGVHFIYKLYLFKKQGPICSIGTFLGVIFC